MIPLALVLAGVRGLQSSLEFFNASQVTEGTVVRVERKIVEDDDRIVTETRAVLDFTVDDRRVEVRQRAGAPRPKYTLGQRVPVRYRVANPYDASVNTFGDLFLSDVILAGVGLAILAMLFFGGRAIFKS